MTIKRYFEPNFTGDTTKSFEEVVDDIEKVMKESVEMHKISDVEVASYLSSGVDSSYLTYLGQVDRTFTVGFDEGKYSEIQDAKEFAASINMKMMQKSSLHRNTGTICPISSIIWMNRWQILRRSHFIF